MIHESYNYNLENNIAAIKVERNIEFDDFTQPACLPERNMKINDDSVTKVNINQAIECAYSIISCIYFISLLVLDHHL